MGHLPPDYYSSKAFASRALGVMADWLNAVPDDERSSARYAKSLDNFLAIRRYLEIASVYAERNPDAQLLRQAIRMDQDEEIRRSSMPKEVVRSMSITRAQRIWPDHF